MCIRPLVAVLFAVTGIPLLADTLAWYHFDEVAPGEKPTPETRFLNAVDPAVAPGRPISQIDWKTKTDDDTHFPQGVSAFPDGFSVLDPVSGDTPVNARALVFTTGKREDDYYGASGVEIANDPTSTTGMLTYECFVRFDLSRTPDGMGSNCKRVILAKNNDNNVIGFKLVYDYWGDWGRNLMVYVNSDSVVNASEIHLEDGKWHHIALTFDAADSSVRVYADYALVGEATGLSADLSKMSNEALAVGFAPYDSSWPRWGGVVDELKISDSALTPQQMLKVQSLSTARPVDIDTAAYQSFSAFRSDGVTDFPLCMQMRNEVLGDGSLGEPSFYAERNAPTQCPDVPIRQIGTSEGLVENARAISFSGYAKGWAFEDPSASLIQGDYTAEMFFRTSDEYSSDCYLMAQDNAMVLQLKSDGLRMNWSGPQARGNFCDGKWHHVALVYVKAEGKYYLYVDYTQRGSKESSPSPETAEKAFRFGGESVSYWNPFHDIDIDEVRITRRALGPDEFIHPYDSMVAWEISCDASDILASRLWSTVPDFSEMKYWFFDSSDKPNAQVAEDLLSEPRANESSIATTGGVNRCKGIVLNDPEKSVVTGPFTVEFCYQLADGYVPDDAEYMFFIDGGCHIQLNNGELLVQDKDWKDIAKNYAPADGKWHHVAVIYDPDKGEFRTYFDYAYLGRRDGSIGQSAVGDKIYIGNDAWNKSPRTWKFDNVRVTRKALKPCEFLTSKHVEGPTLAWAYFDNGVGSFAQEYDEAATYSCEATFASHGAGAEVLDAEGNVLRENTGSIRMADGAAFYSRLSLLERTDLTVEFFLRASAITNGTDVLSLTAKDASTPIWSLRAFDGALKVFVGSDAVADAGVITSGWMHFAVVFDPSADGSSTFVRAYRNHELVDEKSFTGTLAVEGLKGSSLKIGSFVGSMDELRFTGGALDITEMLYRPMPGGLLLLVR